MSNETQVPMVSPVSICNMALGWLGANRIEEFTGNSTPSQLCRDNYEMVRDSVLEERNWTFAQRREVSDVSATEPETGQYQHYIDDDWMRIHRVKRPVASNRLAPVNSWVVEGDYVLCEYPKIVMFGGRRISDTGKYTPLFVQALAARMAATLAIPLTENRQVAADMWALYDTFVSQAAARDGQQGSNEQFSTGDLVGVRGTSGLAMRGGEM